MTDPSPAPSPSPAPGHPSVGAERRPRWLWICAELLEDLTTGLLVYTHGLSAAVARAGVDITMVGIAPGSPTRDDLDLRPVPGTLRGGWRSVLSPLPNLSYACATPALKAEVGRQLARGGWDAIVIDHLQVAWAQDLIADDDPTPVVFITHNHEASMRREVAAEIPITSPRGLPLRLDAVKAARLEGRTIERADVVTSITESDRARFRNDRPDARARHVVVTPGWSGTAPDDRTPLADRPRRIGILGSFEWHVKQENLLRFARAAAPLLHAEGIELAVAGRIPDDFRLRLLDECPTVTCIGWVESIPDFLDTCRLGVVAEPLGGGFKLKSLDYVALRVPIGATAGSLKGLPLVAGDSVVEAPDEATLAEELVAVVDDAPTLERLADRAFSACAPTLLWTEQVRLLTEAVDQTAGRR